MNNDVKLGKFISLILRHKPETIDLKLDENGWADTKELIEKISKSGREIDFETLERIVNENNKKRYSFNEDKTKIRAVQGHSIEVNLELKEVVPPVVLYHGTAFKNVESIKKEGIKKMERQHVHLSADLETAERYFESAVMLCIANIDGKDCFILEKRAKNIRQAGEISFPGGKKDKTDKTFKETAIRETMEELQIKRNKISNVSKFGLLVAPLGVLIECYICKLNIENLDEINYNRDEVEKLLAVPIEFFLETEAIKGEVEICNKAKFDIKKYNFPKRYENDWRVPNRFVYIYMFEEEPVWGMTAEIICDFINTLKKEGKVGFYEYK